jgi:hypothetical protein
MIITRPASRIRQGNLVLYATSLRVHDLKVNQFYRIDTLDQTREKAISDY